MLILRNSIKKVQNNAPFFVFAIEMGKFLLYNSLEWFTMDNIGYGGNFMITKEDLKMLCDLSRLDLSDNELEFYEKSMQDVMGLMDTIGESDFTYNNKDMENAVSFSELRADEVSTYENMRGILNNGPEVDDDQFVVPKVID